MDSKEAGWQHFAGADWAAARDSFAEALEADPGDPEALDGLGQALWWLGDRDAGIDRRRQAYAAYRRRGDARNAGGLADVSRGRAPDRRPGRRPRRAGWHGRGACSPSEGTVSETAGWRSRRPSAPTDPAAAERHAREALRGGAGAGDPDVECMALAQVGRALVRQGRVEEGVDCSTRR